ncbi:TPA: hypothetical protein DCX16_06920 [bacterium]|nr:hypothetical protein [bacterium]
MVLFVFFTSFVVYLLTMTPTLNLHDSGEMITASWTLGIAHPPGYPLYCLFGKLLSETIGIGNIAYRMNFFSSLSSSLCSMVLYLIALKIYKSKLPAIIVALSFSFSKIFWQQTVISEKYTLNAFFLSLLILTLLKWRESVRIVQPQVHNNRYLYLFTFLLGLSFSHHFQTVFIVPAGIFFIIWTLRSIKKKKIKINYFILSILFLIPVSLYLYLPIRASVHPPANWGSPDTLERFISHITVQEYKHYFAPQEQWLSNFIKHLSFFPAQFTWIILVLSIVGYFFMIKKRMGLSVFFGLIVCFDILHSVRYSIHNIEDYYIPSFLVFSIFVGEAILFAKKYLKKVTFILVVLPIVPFFTNYYYANRDRDFYSYDYARNILEPVEKNGIVLIMGDTFAFPLWYLHFVENFRCDVSLIDKLELRYDWYCDDVKERYKDLAFEYQPSKKPDPQFISQRFLEIVNKNIKRKAIYVPFPFADEVKETHILVPAGICHKIVERGINVDNEIKKTSFRFKYRPTGVFMEERTKNNWENYAIAQESRASFLAERKYYDDAIFYLNEAIKVNPEKTSSIYNLGVLYKDMGRLNEAEDIFKKIGDRADGHYGLGMVYQKKGMLDEAINKYKKAIEQDPNKLFLYHSLGSCYLEKGMFDEAILSFSDALKIEPNDPNAYYNLGIVYWKKGSINEAISAYKKVLELSPNYPGVRESLRILGGY